MATSFLEWWHLRMGKSRASHKGGHHARAQDHRRQHLRLSKMTLVGVLQMSFRRTLPRVDVQVVIVGP